MSILPPWRRALAGFAFPSVSHSLTRPKRAQEMTRPSDCSSPGPSSEKPQPVSTGREVSEPLSLHSTKAPSPSNTDQCTSCVRLCFGLDGLDGRRSYPCRMSALLDVLHTTSQASDGENRNLKTMGEWKDDKKLQVTHCLQCPRYLSGTKQSPHGPHFAEKQFKAS